MADRRFVSLGLFLLGIGIAATALLGPLATDTIDYRFSENMENQTIGGDAVLLLIVVPLLLVAGYLWLKDHRFAPLLAIAPAAFAAYTFLGFILIPDYTRYEGNNEKYFPLFVAVLALGFAVTAASWSALARQELREPDRRLRGITAAVLMLVGIFVGLTWSSQIADVMAGDYSTEYLDHPTAFWLIRTLDFGIVIPASLATGIGLLRGSRTALRSAIALTGFLTLMFASIASMALVLVARDDPAAEPVALVVLLPATAGLGLLTWKLWQVTGTPEAGQRETPEPERLGVWAHG